MELSGFPVDSFACRVPSPFPVHFRCGAFRNEGSAWRVGPITTMDRHGGSVLKRGRPVIPSVSYGALIAFSFTRLKKIHIKSLRLE